MFLRLLGYRCHPRRNFGNLEARNCFRKEIVERCRQGLLRGGCALLPRPPVALSRLRSRPPAVRQRSHPFFSLAAPDLAVAQSGATPAMLLRNNAQSGRPRVQAARLPLSYLTGKDFGPTAGASKEERAAAIKKWRAWWTSREKEPQINADKRR